MLKHVQISPHRNRSDSVSLRSSTSCASSLCGSPEPPSDSIRTPSRASSYCSLNEAIPQTTIKVYTACLRLDIEYKTLGIQWDTTSKDVVAQLLRRCKMRQKDPRLFYLSMEVTVRKAGVRTVLVLDDEARPAILQACHPKGDSRFCLQIKPGGLIRVHTSVLQATSLYKSLFISEETTSDELLALLLSCFNLTDPVEQYSLYEVCPSQEYQRKLHPDDLPLRAQQQRTQRGEQCHFIVRKNPHYPRRRQLLPPIIETKSAMNETNSTSVCDRIADITSNNNNNTTITNTTTTTSTPNTDENGNSRRYVSVYTFEKPTNVCKMCRNNFRSCEFCQKNVARKLSCTRLARIPTAINLHEPQHDENALIPKKSNNIVSTYNPVYNIREIRTVCNSFSSLAVDKKLLDVVECSSQKVIASTTPTNASQSLSISAPNHRHSIADSTNSTPIVQEAVNNNPAKGYGSYVYI